MKRLMITALFGLMVLLGYAAMITQSEAQVIGISVFTQLSGSRPAFMNSEAYFGTYAEETADFYILRFEPAGFILVAGDDKSIPILGYALDSEFPMGEPPAHVKWYLDQYSRNLQEIRQQQDLRVDGTWAALRRGDFSAYTFSRDVAPLTSTSWDQDYPYNYYCPADASGPGGRVYAGCVATAMAQVMKKWNHPTTGQGSHSYYASGYGTQSANFGATTYNWAGMPNSITTVNTEIATLLYHCGVAVDMMYAPDGSGAYGSDARNALVNYFRYNNSAQYLDASSYTSSTWATMLRSDLDLGRPIFYRGQGPSGGHAFVLDGYQGTNSFHFNWGWSGYYNGYFYLTNLNPGTHTFTQYQGAIMYVYPVSQSILTGTVTSGGSPLSGVTISLVGTTLSATTNASGSYTINGIAAGTYQVTASKTGYASVTLPATLAPGQTLTLNFTLSAAQNLIPPQNLQASVFGNDVELSWTSPVTPQPGQWITWSNDVLGNSIGTNAASDFDVAQRWTPVDLAAYQGGTINQVKFVPSYDNCVYTLKIWTGGTSITNPGTLVYSQAISPITVGEWNLVVLNSPIPIPSVGELRIGYNVNTQGGYPAGCDAGPVIEGKGNVMYFSGAWTTLTALAPTLTYNWLIQAFATTGRELKPVQAVAIPELRKPHVNQGSLALHSYPVPEATTNRALLGYKVYRNGTLINTIYDPAITTYTDMDLPNSTYVYNVTAVYSDGESVPASINVTVFMQLPPMLFGDGFETHPNFALSFAPWTCLDVDMSDTYGFNGYTYPNNEGAMAFMIFNPSATTPPMTTVSTHDGSKMAASFAATMAPNNDWMVTPRLSLGTGSMLRFFARSHTAQYGLERMRVGVSTLSTIIPQGFQYLTGDTYVQVPVNWTEYTYDLSAYDNQQVYIGIRCSSDDAFVLYVDDFAVYSLGGGTQMDPFGNPVTLPTSMSVVANVLINGQQASNGDVVAAFVNVGGTPQLRGKQTVQVVNGVAGCILQVYTETNGEVVNFKVWKSSINQVLDCPTTLNTVVNGTIGEWPDNLYVINASTGTTQNIALTSGWNLISLNVSPADHSLATLLTGISASVQQVKGTEGVYIPGNPYSTLSALTDGKAYNIQVSAPVTWSVNGTQIPANTPLALNAGWNMTAYLPQAAMPVTTAMQSVSTWLQQVKGTDGVYIPENPYSTLTSMNPGKGYWIRLSAAHNLIYPTGRYAVEPVQATIHSGITTLTSSMVLLARCDGARAGDILIARVNGELRGAETLITPEGFPAALLQIYTAASGEEVSLWLQKPDGSEVELANRFSSEPNSTLGSYPQFISLHLKNGDPGVAVLATRLSGCYPNPFNPSTTISFSIAEESALVSVNIYNLKGQKVRQLAHTEYPRGEHQLVFGGTDDQGRALSSGIYLIELQAGNYRKTIKSLLSK